MKFIHAAGIAAVLIVAQSGASAASFEALTSPGFTTETTSVVNQYLMPEAPAGSTVTSYSVLSTASGFASTATINFAAPVSSFTFLWGSPDSFNSVSDGSFVVTGSKVSSGTGKNSESLLYTYTDPAGMFSSLTFSTTGIAFELAEPTPVPEPGPYALLLAGMGAVAFAVRRRI